MHDDHAGGTPPILAHPPRALLRVLEQKMHELERDRALGLPFPGPERNGGGDMEATGSWRTRGSSTPRAMHHRRSIPRTPRQDMMRQREAMWATRLPDKTTLGWERQNSNHEGPLRFISPMVFFGSKRRFQ